MKSFLEYVAHDVLEKYGHDLSRLAMVFPNKRASLFFNEHLARLAGRPVWSPAYITISDLFRSHSTLQTGDPIKLVCDLHKCFVQVTGIQESLDHFYGWGQVLLADFDDIDKNMADASKVFANLRDLHELDDVSYLTEEQKAIIRKFFGNFSDEQQSELKQRFLKLWSHFIDIYHSYNDYLEQQGLAYEGALYKKVATDETVTFEHEAYLFVGFNLIQPVEQILFRRLKKEGKARFYWDFDHYYLQSSKLKAPSSKDNEAGHFISQYLDQFPNELDIDCDEIYRNFQKPKHITYLSAATENIQAHYMAQWLKESDRLKAGKRTAVVLCNEALLPMAIHCLPEEVDKVNITTGYPLSQSPVSSLLMQLFSLQTLGYNKKKHTFRPPFRNKVLRHPYISFLRGDEQETEKLLFRQFDDLKPMELCSWMAEVMKTIALRSREQEEQTASPLFAETLFRTYTLLNRLYSLMESGDLNIDLTTLHRLLLQLVRSTSIPFHGEPAVGLQVMGVLETRNLDFDHVLVLSCNEGNMPKGVNDTSFIPYNIRKAFGLTTIDHKVAIYSYYFHRLMQRCEDVTLVYNNATEDGKTGEMSRFMLQMLVESSHSIEQQAIKTNHSIGRPSRTTIQKTPKMMQLLRQRFKASPDQPVLSPTAINRYMSCPLKFYYHYVSGIQEYQEEEEDTIDGRMFGNIFHKAAENIYNELGFNVTAAPLQALLKHPASIARAVDAAFKTELFQLKASDSMPELNGIQTINREVIIRYLRQLLTYDLKLAPFTIIGLELPVMNEWRVEPQGDEPFLTTVGGKIDRLDCIRNANGEEVIRIVDYKTGRFKEEVMPDVASIFSQDYVDKHSDYYLQTFLYATIVNRLQTTGSMPQATSSKLQVQSSKLQAQSITPALFFVQQSNQDSYDPTLKLGKQPIQDIKVYEDEFVEGVKTVVNEIFSPGVSFSPTTVTSRCTKCPFQQLCT